MFIDSHAHLEMEQFDADREQMIARARDGGIEKIVAIGSGTGPGSLDCGIQLAEQQNLSLATIGIHPHEAKLATDADFQELEQLANGPRSLPGAKSGWTTSTIIRRASCSSKFSAADGIGAGGQAADRDSLPALRRQRQRLGRLPRSSGTTLESRADWAESCTVSPGPGLTPNGPSTWGS